MSAGLVKRLTGLAVQCLGEMGMQLYHLDYRPSGTRSVLRLYIEREGGVNLDDCAAVSRRFGDLLDADDVLPASYVLEVSSPGLDRALHEPAHYQRFSGQTVRVTLFEPIDGRRHFQGRILSCDGETIRLALDEGASVDLPFAKVAGGHLVVEF